MEQLEKTRWEGNEHWFKFDHCPGLKRFDEITTLWSTSTAVALRTIKYQLENELGFEINDALFCEIFKKVCDFRPVPALEAYACLEFIQHLQRILEGHGIPGKKVEAIGRTFRFRVENPRCYQKLLLHVPHASTIFPKNSNVSFHDLDKDERLLIDYYTDELFVPKQTDERIEAIVFPYCRLYCDVERLINDPLEEKGLGISYSRWVNNDGYGKTLHSFSSLNSVFKLYSDFHTDASMKILNTTGIPLVIDCHSFSSIPNLINKNNSSDIDICIGYNDDSTHPDEVTIGNIVQYFILHGYKVGINNPFCNSKTFSVPKDYKSVMIEVNKKLYMDEHTLAKKEGFSKLKHDIQSLYKILLK